MAAIENAIPSPKKVLTNAEYHRRNARRRRVTFLLLAAPALLWFLTLMGWPLLNMFYISTMRWDGLALPQKFIFLDNFVRFFQDRNISIALRNTGIHLLVGIPGVVPPAFMLGFFLSLRKPGYRILRTIFFSPSMISVAALAMIFLGLYRPDGMLNAFLNTHRLVLAQQGLAREPVDGPGRDHRHRHVGRHRFLQRPLLRRADQHPGRAVRGRPARRGRLLDHHVEDRLPADARLFWRRHHPAVPVHPLRGGSECHAPDPGRAGDRDHSPSDIICTTRHSSTSGWDTARRSRCWSFSSASPRSS